MIVPFLVATVFAFAMLIIAYQLGFSTLLNGEAYILLIGIYSGSRYASVGSNGFARYVSLVNLVFYFNFALFVLSSRFYKNFYHIKVIPGKKTAKRIEYIFWVSLAMMVMNAFVFIVFLAE